MHALIIASCIFAAGCVAKTIAFWCQDWAGYSLVSFLVFMGVIYSIA